MGGPNRHITNPRWQMSAILKNCHILATVWPIDTKYHNCAHNNVHRSNVRSVSAACHLQGQLLHRWCTVLPQCQWLSARTSFPPSDEPRRAESICHYRLRHVHQCSAPYSAITSPLNHQVHSALNSPTCPCLLIDTHTITGCVTSTSVVRRTVH